MAAFTICFGPADRLLGGLAELSGRTDARRRALPGRARNWPSAASHRCGRAEVLFDWAAALSARGDVRAGRRSSASGPTNWRHESGWTGMPAARRRGAAIARPLPAGLSEREAEVLRCVAEGLSNREIGAPLFISQNTVANHIRAILRKTGCANRTEATTYAHRTGIIGR